MKQTIETPQDGAGNEIAGKAKLPKLSNKYFLPTDLELAHPNQFANCLLFQI